MASCPVGSDASSTWAPASSSRRAHSPCRPVENPHGFERAMDQPAHRGPVELAILRIDRRIVPQNVLHHVRVAVERRPVQRHGAVLRQRRHRKSAAQHGSDGRKVVVAGGVGDLTQSPFRRMRHELRVGREGRVGACIVAAPERIKQSIERTRAPRAAGRGPRHGRACARRRTPRRGSRASIGRYARRLAAVSIIGNQS